MKPYITIGDPLNHLTPRRKINGHSKIPVSKGHHCLLTKRKKQQTDSSIGCSESSAIMGSHTVQFPPTESFTNNVNTRVKTGRFRKCSEKGTCPLLYIHVYCRYLIKLIMIFS